MKQTKSLGVHFGGEKIYPGRIAARSGETGNQTQLDRVFGDAEDDRDRRGRGFRHRGCSGEGGRGNHGHATADEVGHERRQAIVFALQPVVFDHHVLGLDVASFVKGLTEHSAEARGFLRRSGADKTNDRHGCLLRTGSPRPRYCSANQRKELAPPHVLSSSRGQHSTTSS